MNESSSFRQHDQQAFLRALKTFAFEQSAAFRDDRSAEIDVTKTTTYRDPELNRRGDFIKTSLGFIATRLYPDQYWPEPGYQFITTASTESSLDAIPEAILAEFADETGVAEEDLYDPAVDTLTQTLSTSCTVDTIYPDSINTETAYTLRCNGDLVWESNTDELSQLPVDKVQVPRVESLQHDTRSDEDGPDQTTTLYIPRPINQERLDEVEHGLIAIAFEQVIGTLTLNRPIAQFENYDIKARQMLHIIEQMRSDQ